MCKASPIILRNISNVSESMESYPTLNDTSLIGVLYWACTVQSIEEFSTHCVLIGKRPSYRESTGTGQVEKPEVASSCRRKRKEKSVGARVASRNWGSSAIELEANECRITNLGYRAAPCPVATVDSSNAVFSGNNARRAM
jgi:hypothetical protein